MIGWEMCGSDTGGTVCRKFRGVVHQVVESDLVQAWVQVESQPGVKSVPEVDSCGALSKVI